MDSEPVSESIECEGITVQHHSSFQGWILEPARLRQRLGALAEREHALDKPIAPIAGGPAHAYAEYDGRSNVVRVVQLELGKARANVGLANENVQPRICVDVVPVRMEEDRLLADADNFEDDPVSVSSARREFWNEIEISPIAVSFDAEAQEPNGLGGV